MAPIGPHHLTPIPLFIPSTFNACILNISSLRCHLPKPPTLLPRDDLDTTASTATQPASDYARANLHAVLYYLAALIAYLSIITFILFFVIRGCSCSRRRPQPRPHHQRMWPAAPRNNTVNLATLPGTDVEMQPIPGPLTVERVAEVQAPKLAAFRGLMRGDGGVGSDVEGGEAPPAYVEAEAEAEAPPGYREGERDESSSSAAPSYREAESRDPAVEAEGR